MGLCLCMVLELLRIVTISQADFRVILARSHLREGFAAFLTHKNKSPNHDVTIRDFLIATDTYDVYVQNK